jgi:uncharacterized protein (TIGR03437 family)
MGAGPAIRLVVLGCCITGCPAWASESDAIAISANIRARHMPFGTVLDPVFNAPDSFQITGYTRCGDSALWTGAYLAAESFRYNVTRSADALANVNAALAGLKALADVTGDNRLARCIVPADSPYAAGIASEEAHNTVHHNPPWIWLDNTSRDQVVGAFFGLGVAYDLVDDASVRQGVSDLATRLIGFISRHHWSPNDDIASTFELRPESLQTLLQVARHVNPANGVSGPFFVLPANTAVLVDIQSNDSYFKFNLDYMSFYHLVWLQDNDSNRGAYRTVRNYTEGHQNAFFDVIDRALTGPNDTRDSRIQSLLDQWLQRPRRDPFVDLSSAVRVCGVEACLPVPVPSRPPTDFLWQRDPFQLKGGGNGLIESAGIDYILPYWMARYYGVIAGAPVVSAAAPSNAVAPDSLASIYGTNLAAATAQATTLPLPAVLGGAMLNLTDASGAQRAAGLVYASPAQINFVIPAGTSPGEATFAVANGSAAQTYTAMVERVVPRLFSADGSGTGVAAATAILTQAADPRVQSPVPVFQCTNSGCSAVPIHLGVDTPIYVTFYGTGIRNRSSTSNVAIVIGSLSVPVLYAGPSPGFAGLDQVNVALPLNLRGSGELNVSLTADGQVSNVVKIAVE